MEVKKKELGHYLNLPWSYTIETVLKNNMVTYVVYVNELPHARAESTHVVEALDKVKQSIKMVINMYLEMNVPIPEPLTKDKCKGRIAYRTSSERHFSLARMAARRKLSLSKIIDSALDHYLKEFE